jgi:hypothetical protein
MAKLKNKINSKYKYQVKRKLILGGPEQELYLNNNTTYQAQTPPTAMLQNQFDAQEQEKAKRMSTIYGNQVARELDYLQDINKSEVERKQEEQKQRDATAAANAQQVQTTATKDIGTTGLTTGLQAAKSAYQIQQTTNAAMAAAKPTVQYSSQIGTWAGSGPSSPIVQSAAKSGLQAGASAAGSAALIAAPQIAGQIAYNQLNKADDKQIKAQDKSQYYDDTDYSRKEYNAQLLKSAGKGATIGGTIASAIPIPGVSTGIGMAAGALIGTGVGAIKAQHQRRMTKTEDERGVKIGNKRFGKKLLFGEENVYSASKDPNEIAKKEYEKALKNQEELSAQLSNQFLSSRLQSDTNTGFNVAKYGGAIKKLKGGVAKPIGKGAVEYIGKKHEHGGIDLPGNIEVEGGETEQNNYIFSATLKLPNGATYAQAHKNLIKSGASGEEIHQLALSQEAAAGRNPNEIKSMKFAKYGGPLMYVNGGPKDSDKKEPNKEKLNYFTSGQFAEDQKNVGPTIINKGRDLQYWQDLECLRNPENCMSPAAIKTLEEKYGPEYWPVGTQNYNLKQAALSGDITPDFLKDISKRDFRYRNDPEKEGYDPARSNIRLSPKSVQYLEKPFTNEEIEYYKGNATSPDTPSYVTAKEPDIVVSGRTKQYWQDLECVRNPSSSGCLSPKSEEKYKKYGEDYGIVTRENYKLKNAALTGNIPSWFLEDRKKADDYNRNVQRSWYSFEKGIPVPYKGINPESQQYLERPFTDAEIAYYLGQKDNPDSTIPNPANSTTLPNLELFTEDIYGQGPAVEFNTRVPAGEFSAEAAKNLPAKTNKAKQAFNKLQNTLKEKAAQRAEDNKVYNAPELPEVVITGSNPQQDVLNLIQGKDISRIAGPNSNLKLATYNLPELTNPAVSTFVPDEVVSQIEDNKMYAGKDLPEVVINAIRPKATTQVVNNTVPETVTTKKDPTEGMTRDERLEYYRKQRNLPEGTVMLPPAVAMSKAQKDMLLNEDKELVTPSLNVEPPVESDKNVSTENNKKSTIDLPPPPTYTRTKSTNNLGLIQTIPAAIALTNNIKTKNITPSVTTSYVQPGSIGQINLGRVSMSAEKAANQQNQAAITQALQNMSGPGAIAGMVAAKTKADQQALQIAQAEQNINMGRAGEEAKINAGISQFNVGQSMAAQQARANIDQANAARMQQAMQFNTQLKYARDVENREQRLGALDRAAQAITMNALANRQLDVTENLANVQDYTDAYKRYVEQMDKQQANQGKFGGAKKYISRLGDLKNVKYKV